MNLTFRLRLQNHLWSHLIFFNYRIDFLHLCQLLRMAPRADPLLPGRSSTIAMAQSSSPGTCACHYRPSPAAGPARTGSSLAAAGVLPRQASILPTVDHPSVQLASSSCASIGCTCCTVGVAQRSTGHGLSTVTRADRHFFTPRDAATDWHTSTSAAAFDLLHHARFTDSCQLSQRAC